MPHPSTIYRCFFGFITVFCMWLAPVVPVSGDETAALPDMDLDRTVALALEANISARISSERTRGADALVKSRRTEFLPTFSAQYNYTRNDEPRYSVIPILGVVQPEEEYAFVTSVTQPLFTGFTLTSQYQLARMGLDAARLNEALVRRDIVFEAKRVYFDLLKALKLKVVAEEAVTMLEAQTEVAVNYHEVGMTPLNDLLKTKVELANARQDLVAAQHGLEIARAEFNLLLRRPIGTSVTPVDILDYAPLSRTLAECLDTGEKDRVEVAVAGLEIQIREKEVTLAERDYYPMVQVQGNYYKLGTDWQVAGGEGISDSSFWDVQAQARWDFWQWGRTGHGVAEKKSKLAEARLNRTELLDNIQREVKQAWLKADEFEKNIVTVQSAIDQAREGFRISEALFKEQMATSTDVLDARTQLSETMTRYYNALYDFQIALAALDRAMGKPTIEIAEVQ
ncbi:TolC family protein [uncultured Desulfosarcina sp.]|uniref:TolC family protein n=1 Tax=uncultured Desulfosarcina sp. TaxID=218289 RepID=UPI0029C76C02|nr:TolC family protein [uncultured Desulfosarcina sp.]